MAPAHSSTDVRRLTIITCRVFFSVCSSSTNDPEGVAGCRNQNKTRQGRNFDREGTGTFVSQSGHTGTYWVGATIGYRAGCGHEAAEPDAQQCNSCPLPPPKVVGK
eukprot:NODE_3040_length_990_cov_4.272051_g2539_i0.p1 GENE.NODE_3040_length_990_cov_4.272051_g2539_i0~~NODE_3040_length_990_cov_4.272051_g2539_i0.p1  ORF type:complete len:106 (+),score=0.66 NODE_3040_length_990_cov_4.272051_g2539_i0:330-647(+)